MNLIYSCLFYNEKYLLIIEKLLVSFHKYNKSSNLIYLIITSPKLENKVLEICKKIDLKFKIWTLNICNNETEIYNIYESTYVRYFIYKYPELNNYKKILYLDCDILVLNNLEVLFNIETSNNIYAMFETSHRTGHGSLFNDTEFEILKKNKATFTTAILLFDNNSIILSYVENIFNNIRNFHNKYNNPLHCYDQPIVNKIDYNYKIINNKILNNYCLNIEPNDGLEKITNISKYLLCHFATNVGDSKSKIIRINIVENYLNNDFINNDVINNDVINNDVINNDVISNDVINNDVINNDFIINDVINNDVIKKTKILIGTPAYGGQCYTKYTESLLYTIKLLENNNIECEVKFINNQIVTRARNMIASVFMNDESFTHLLFIDSDIEWNPEYVLYLLEHNLECVIGIYPNKQYINEDSKITLNPSSSYFIPKIERNNLIKIKYAATGFMLIKKSALKKIEKDVGMFYLPDDYNNETVFLYNYFDCNIVDFNYLTEDYYFSHLLYKNNCEIWADKRINLYHLGTHRYGEIIN